MGRHKPKIAQYSGSPGKKQVYTTPVSNIKNAHLGGDPGTTQKAPLAWNFHLMDEGGPWACSLKALETYKNRLYRFEGQTVNEIFNPGSGNRHSHPTGKHNISEAAQARLNTLNIDGSVLYQLPLGQIPRLWGVLQHNIFHILWLDEKHEICP